MSAEPPHQEEKQQPSKKKLEKAHGVKVGFCGQQPSDSNEFCDFLIESGIDSISITPDSAIKTYSYLTKSFSVNRSF